MVRTYTPEELSYWASMEEYCELLSVNSTDVMNQAAKEWTRDVHYKIEKGRMFMDLYAISVLENPHLVAKAKIDYSAMPSNLRDVLAVSALSYTREAGWFEGHNLKHRYLYAMSCGRFVKIGISNNPHARVDALQTGNPLDIHLELVYRPPGELPVTYLESVIHRELASLGVRGEWFKKQAMRQLKTTPRSLTRNQDRLSSISTACLDPSL